MTNKTSEVSRRYTIVPDFAQLPKLERMIDTIREVSLAIIDGHRESLAQHGEERRLLGEREMRSIIDRMLIDRSEIFTDIDLSDVYPIVDDYRERIRSLSHLRKDVVLSKLERISKFTIRSTYAYRLTPTYVDIIRIGRIARNVPGPIPENLSHMKLYKFRGKWVMEFVDSEAEDRKKRIAATKKIRAKQRRNTNAKYNRNTRVVKEPALKDAPAMRYVVDDPNHSTTEKKIKKY